MTHHTITYFVWSLFCIYILRDVCPIYITPPFFIFFSDTILCSVRVVMVKTVLMANGME